MGGSITDIFRLFILNFTNQETRDGKVGENLRNILGAFKEAEWFWIMRDNNARPRWYEGDAMCPIP